jgi:hypothetical protein
MVYIKKELWMYGGNTAKDFNAASKNGTIPVGETYKGNHKIMNFRQICFI